MRNNFVCILSLVGLVVGITIFKMINIPRDYMLYNWVALPCFISLMVSLGSYKFKVVQNSKLIKYLSELSFCIFLGQIIYVWDAVKYVLDYWGTDNNIMKILASFIIVFCTANILHYLVEVPSSMYLKQRFLMNN